MNACPRQRRAAVFELNLRALLAAQRLCFQKNGDTMMNTIFHTPVFHTPSLRLWKSEIAIGKALCAGRPHSHWPQELRAGRRALTRSAAYLYIQLGRLAFCQSKNTHFLRPPPRPASVVLARDWHFTVASCSAAILSLPTGQCLRESVRTNVLQREREKPERKKSMNNESIESGRFVCSYCGQMFIYCPLAAASH